MGGQDCGGLYDPGTRLGWRLFFFCPTSLLKEGLNGIHQGAPQKCPNYTLMGKMGIKLCKE